MRQCWPSSASRASHILGIRHRLSKYGDSETQQRSGRTMFQQGYRCRPHPQHTQLACTHDETSDGHCCAFYDNSTSTCCIEPGLYLPPVSLTTNPLFARNCSPCRKNYHSTLPKCRSQTYKKRRAQRALIAWIKIRISLSKPPDRDGCSISRRSSGDISWALACSCTSLLLHGL